MYSRYQDGSNVAPQNVIHANWSPLGKVYKTDIIRCSEIEFPARRTGEDTCFVVNYVTNCKA